MKRIVLTLVLCLLLAGCGNWMAGEYHSATPHKVKEQPQEQTIPAVSGYNELRAALIDMVEDGAESGRVSVEDYRSMAVESNMELVVEDIRKNHPLGAYAVEDITFEQGTSGGLSTLAVAISYTRSPEELQSIRTAATMDTAQKLLTDALVACEAAVVLRVQNYEERDLVQLVDDFARENPDKVMETPQVAVSVYPESGSDRVVDIRFTYQTSRDTLRQMQKYCEPVFSSAQLYVSSEEESQAVKFARLYTFLMERNDYKTGTSITPTYSLLRHGVGDSRAFAVVYAAMCRRAGLECMVVSGTYQGESRHWNIICDDGMYCHVDILGKNGFVKYTDKQMAGYVWDYSAYPVCNGAKANAQ